MVLGAFVTYVSRSSCAAQPRTSRPFLRAGADFGGVSSWSAVLCGCGGTGPRARAHVRVLSLYSQLLLLPHSNRSNTSRGRPGARHPPLRGDSATPGRLPAAQPLLRPKTTAGATAGMLDVDAILPALERGRCMTSHCGARCMLVLSLSARPFTHPVAASCTAGTNHPRSRA